MGVSDTRVRKADAVLQTVSILVDLEIESLTGAKEAR